LPAPHTTPEALELNQILAEAAGIGATEAIMEVSSHALAQQRVTEQHLWMPVMNVAMYTTSLKKLKGVRPHMIYQNTFYKGLDYSF